MGGVASFFHIGDSLLRCVAVQYCIRHPLQTGQLLAFFNCIKKTECALCSQPRKSVSTSDMIEEHTNLFYFCLIFIIILDKNQDMRPYQKPTKHCEIMENGQQI